jgi:hypothetical protein
MQDSYVARPSVNFNVYLDADAVDRLNALARKQGTTRNALIREAVALLLERQPRGAWPQEVLAFQGEPDAPAFEQPRKRLRPPRKVPLR